MRKVILRFSIIPIFILLTYLAIFLIPVKHNLVYATILDKHNLLKSANSPKIIFIGGSNLALGLDSELIEEKTGYSIINMGLNGGLGLRYMLNEIRPYINRNDVIVITPEYEHFYGDLLDGGINLLWIIQIMPESAHYLTLGQYLKLIKNVPEFMQFRIKEILSFEQDSIYNRQGFNKYGDFVNHLGLEPKANLEGIKRINAEDFNPDAIEVVNEFVEFTDTKGATVVYIFPPLADSQYNFLT